MPFFFSLFSVFFRICVFLIQLLRFILSLSLSLRIRIRSSAEIETLLFCLRLNFCEERGEAEAEAGNWNEKENENEGQARDMCRYKDTRRLCVATGFPAGPRILGTKDSRCRWLSIDFAILTMCSPERLPSEISGFSQRANIAPTHVQVSFARHSLLFRPRGQRDTDSQGMN